MENKTYKVLLAHSAQQHSFRTATALEKSGVLFKYITTVYDKKHSLTSFTKRVLSGDNLTRANKRRCNSLSDNDVIQFCEFESLILLLLYRIDKKKNIYNIWNRFIIYKFNIKVANYAIKNNVDAVIMYDTLAYKTFEILKKKAPHIKRIIDMSAPYSLYMDKIFKIDLQKNNRYSDILRREICSTQYLNMLDNSIKETKLADYFLVASNFTMNSLIYEGVPNSKILMCPYGIDSNIYSYNKKRENMYEEIRCIFVGTITQKKGAFYLLEAIKELKHKRFSFMFVGTYDKKSEYYKDFKDICKFTGYVTKEKVVDFCSKSDILIFPSLADGFGLSALEAMSCGLPVICTSNSGVSDLIINGYNGFVINAGNEKEIYEKLMWFDNNRDKLKDMRENARNTSLKCTWNKYDLCIQKSIEKIRMDAAKDEI